MYLLRMRYAIVNHMKDTALKTQAFICKKLGVAPLTFRRTWPDCPCVILGTKNKRGKGCKVRYIWEQVEEYVKQQAINKHNARS